VPYPRDSAHLDREAIFWALRLAERVVDVAAAEGLVILAGVNAGWEGEKEKDDADIKLDAMRAIFSFIFGQLVILRIRDN